MVTKTSETETLATSGLATAFGAPDKYTLGTTTAQITDFTYDFRNRLTRIQNGTSGSPGANEDLELVYDAASNVTSVTDHADSNEFVEYAYDQLHRLTQMKIYSTVSAEYTYSSIGNLTRKKEGTSGADRTLNYPTSGPTAVRPHAVTSTTVNSATELTLGYDLNGNVTSQGSETYVYDASNLLYQRSVASGTMSYIRDGSGGLVKRTNSADGSSTVYIGGLYEKESSGKVIKYYQFYGQTIARREKPASGSATLTYLLHDHLGSTYRALDATGAAISGSRTKYWPYGGVRSGGTITSTDKMFTGQRQEPGTDALGLYDYGARFYSTTVGRFMGVDPIGGGGSQTSNAYMYVSGNPLRHTDPTGMCQTGSCPGDKEREEKEQQQNRHYQQAAAEDWTSAPAMEPYAPCVECLILVAAALAYQEAAATQAWAESNTIAEQDAMAYANAPAEEGGEGDGLFGTSIGSTVGLDGLTAAGKAGIASIRSLAPSREWLGDEVGSRLGATAVVTLDAFNVLMQLNSAVTTYETTLMGALVGFEAGSQDSFAGAFLGAGGGATVGYWVGNSATAPQRGLGLGAKALGANIARLVDDEKTSGSAFPPGAVVDPGLSGATALEGTVNDSQWALPIIINGR